MESLNCEEADSEAKRAFISEAKPMADKLKDGGSRKMCFRADKIDIKDLDMKLEKLMCHTFSKERKREEWQIDLVKLDLRYVIAQGSFGTVHRANYDGQDVAVKIFNWGEDGIATAAEVAAIRASFRQEVAVWHKLSHPNITKFIGASVATSDIKFPKATNGKHVSHSFETCCVVVEYLPGGTLRKFLSKNERNKIAFNVAIQLSLDLARGLYYLHSKKIVHRDVKTENMLLDSNRTLKIADFVVSRVEAENPRDMTRNTGTLAYMAPEVLEGKPYNRKCDVYSFGICLWEIYCCKLPYQDLTFSEISSRVVQKKLRPSIPRCCPNTLANIMKKCWHQNPDKRPEMVEVVKLLEAVDTSKGGGMVPEGKFTGCFCFGPVFGL